MTGEKIISAAIRMHTHLFTGRSHAECFVKMKNGNQQGFIAASGTGHRFVGRKEALEIAINAGQKINKHAPLDELLSEDLYDDEYFVKPRKEGKK